MRPHRRTMLAMCGAGALALLAAPAFAKSRFPGQMHTHLGISNQYPDPPCRICHIQGTTGAGTIQTPFGISMLAHGLSGDSSSLYPALDALDMAQVDSDGDGVPDTQELRDNTDPNTRADVSLSGDPTYGCAVAPVPGRGACGIFALGGATVALAVVRRRRRRHT